MKASDTLKRHNGDTDLRNKVLDYILQFPKAPLSDLSEKFQVSQKTIMAWKAHQTRGTYKGSMKEEEKSLFAQPELELVGCNEEPEPARGEKIRKAKRANELDGKSWMKYSISVWNDVRKTKEELKLNHPAMFPSQLPERLIEIFTTKEMNTILDPFMGSGATLLAAMKLNKKGIGFEIANDYIELAKNRIKTVDLFSANIEPEIYREDARNLLKHLKPGSVDLCITSPPYWDILSEKRTADSKQIKNYVEQENNLGAIGEYREFLGELKNIFEKVYAVMKQGTYCCVVVMDLRKKNRFYPFHSDIASFMQEIGFLYDDLIIWDRRHEYSNLRPLGYPYTFRINKIHEYILIFLKEEK